MSEDAKIAQPLDAKLHQGYDPSLAAKQDGDLFSSVRTTPVAETPEQFQQAAADNMASVNNTINFNQSNTQEAAALAPVAISSLAFTGGNGPVQGPGSNPQTGNVSGNYMPSGTMSAEPLGGFGGDPLVASPVGATGAGGGGGGLPDVSALRSSISAPAPFSGGGGSPATPAQDAAGNPANPGDGGTNPGNGGANSGSGGANPGSGGTNPGSGGTNPGSGGTGPGNGGGEAPTAPVITVPQANGNENQPIPVSIGIAVDTDAGNVTTVIIGNVPNGASLSAGMNNGDGTWTLTLAQLTGLQFTPVHYASGEIDLTVTAITTGNGQSTAATSVLAIDVAGVATTPTLQVQAASGYEDTAIPLQIGAMLVDTDGSETLSVIIGGLPAGSILSAGIDNGNGTWTLTPVQLIDLTLTPPQDFNGTLALSVTAQSVENNTTANASATLNVTIIADASAPTLSVTAASGNEDTAIALNINAGLTGTDDGLSIVIGGVPNGAILSAGMNNGDGSWNLTVGQLAGLTITPALHSDVDFSLSVTATGTAHGTSASQTLSLPVTIAGTATTPLVGAQAANGNEDTAIHLNVTAMLADTDGSETLSVVIGNVPSGGVLSAGTNNGDGTWTLSAGQLTNLTFTPPLHASDVYHLTATAISAENGTTASATANFDVTVNGVATAPILAVQAATGLEDTSIALNITAALGDNDGSEILSVVIGGVPAGSVLSTGIDNGDGSWTLTPAQLVNLTFTPPLHASGDIAFSVLAIASENGTTASVNAVLPITIIGVALLPSVAVTAAVGNEDTGIAVAISAGLDPADTGATLSVTIGNVPNGAILSAGVQTGPGTWALTGADLAGLTFTPPANFSGAVNLIVTANAWENGSVAMHSATLAIQVNGVADVPALMVTAAAGDEDSSIALSITAALSDTDGSETLTVQIAGVPAGAHLSAGIDNGNGSWSLTSGQLNGLTLTPPDLFNGTINLTVTAIAAENGTLATHVETLVVTVDSLANTPDLSVISAIGAEDTAIALNVTAGLVDFSESLSIVISGVPAGGVLSAGLYRGDGAWSLSAAELAGLTFTPPQDFSGTLALTVSAVSTDGMGHSAITTAPLMVTVTPVIDAVSLTLAAASGNEDSFIPLAITVDIADPSETLSVVIGGVPNGALLSAGISNGNGTWTLTGAQLDGLSIRPPSNSSADFALSVMVINTESNGASAVHTGTITVHVSGVADIPLVIASDAAGAKNTAVAVNIGGALSDTDGSESLTYVVTGVPDGFALNHGHNNGDNSWTVTSGQLSGLSLISPYNFQGTVHLNAYSVAHENDGDTVRSLAASFALAVGNPLTLNLNLDAGIGVAGIGTGVGIGLGVNLGGLLSPGGIVVMEDSPILLNDAPLLLGLLSPLQSSLLQNITLSLPAGASLSAGTNLGNGVYQLTAAQLNGLYLIAAPNSDQDFTIGIQAHLTNLVTVNLATTAVHVVAVADVPVLNVANAIAVEGAGSIPLSIATALTDTDGSETLTVTIKDLPPGFKPTIGIDNGDGSYSIPLAQLGSLALVAPSHFSGDVTYTVVAVSTEREGDTSIHTVTGHLHIEAVADAPVIAVDAIHAVERQTAALNLGISLSDTDGSEHLGLITVSGLPTGAVLSHGTDNHDGSWSIAPADLGQVQLTTPAHFSGDVALTVSASAIENGNGANAATSHQIALHIDAVADAPNLTVANENGVADAPTELHLAASLNDTDGSEHLSIVISGMPEGGLLSAGLHNADGSWTLSEWQLNGLSFTAPHDFAGDVTLSATAFAQETSNGNTASVTQSFSVHVEPPNAMRMAAFSMDNSLSEALAANETNTFSAEVSAAPPTSDHDHAFQASHTG